MRDHFEYINRRDPGARPDEDTEIRIRDLLWMVFEGAALFAMVAAVIAFFVGIGALAN